MATSFPSYPDAFNDDEFYANALQVLEVIDHQPKERREMNKPITTTQKIRQHEFDY